MSKPKTLRSGMVLIAPVSDWSDATHLPSARRVILSPLLQNHVATALAPLAQSFRCSKMKLLW
jgi:hypothetical protein